MIKLLSMSEKHGRPKRVPLNEEDIEIIDLMSHGHTRKSIAMMMGVSEAAVCKWLNGVKRELSARTDVEMMAQAMRQGLIS